MQKRYQTYSNNHGSVELYEVVADSSGTVIPVTKILEEGSVGALKETLKNMLTDVSQYDLISMDYVIDTTEDEDCYVEYSEDVVIDCYDKFFK